MLLRSHSYLKSQSSSASLVTAGAFGFLTLMGCPARAPPAWHRPEAPRLLRQPRGFAREAPARSRIAGMLGWRYSAAGARGTAFGMSLERKDAPTAGGSNEPAAIATAPVLARWLGISGKVVYELAKAGVLVRVSRDHFLLEESVRRYCNHVRRTAPHRNAEVEQAMHHQPVMTAK